MIIVLLLFFKSICLYCQRLVLHIHDRWINPKNVRLLKEAAEAKGAKFLIDDYRQTKKSKKRRYTTGTATTSPAATSTSPASSSASSLLSSLGNRAESCRFCANTPQGYCRHHFHLQELQVHKQQQQSSNWCPLGGGFLSRNVEYKQLRKIKRELKRTLQQRSLAAEQHKNTNGSYQTPQTQPQPPPPPPPLYEAINGVHSPASSNTSSYYQDSGYQTIESLTNTSSSLSQLDDRPLENSQEFLDLPSPHSPSVVETTYSFGTCCETPRSPSPVLVRVTSEQSFVSCETISNADTSAPLSTSYL
ncbi:uncharacterized protein LOC106087257 [Stomoxys calcitrans]|uniref:Uncharacterized protein n=1 Tax=Stomoxys calcitrans TaxID=35570 RepID=A0A1I8NXF9_STOCA|nr:uncharacterized protein LOC106087257 [Stomoxys calcitrans]